MTIKLPTSFSFDYPKENLSYYRSEKPREKICAMLLKASCGYCMYCGVSLNTEGMDLSQIEHSVDKSGNKNQKKKANGSYEDTPLTDCKYNLSVACKDCNMKYKKSVAKVDLHGRFITECPDTCEKPCPDYEVLRNYYIEQNKIILQPQGIFDHNVAYEIKYDLFKHLYSPVQSDETQEAFIQQHIIRFHLNREKFSESIIDICSDIVELNELGVDDTKKLLDYMLQKKHINVIGKVFFDNLYEQFYDDSIEKLLKFCRTIVLCSAWI